MDNDDNAVPSSVMPSPVIDPIGGGEAEANDHQTTMPHNDNGQSSDAFASTTPSPAPDPDHNNNEIAARLDRELALSHAHRLELRSHWRDVLSKEKFDELHGGLARLREHHEENVQRKTDVIDARRGEIGHLQDLYRDATVAHMHRVEDLIAIHDDGAVSLEKDFRERVASLQSQFRTDAAQIIARYEAEKEAVRQSLRRLAKRDEDTTRSLRQAHQHELEEIRNRHLEHVNGLRFVMDSRAEELDEHFEQTHAELAQTTDGARTAYESLKAKEAAVRKEVERKARRANRLQKEVQRVRLIAKQEGAQIEERRRELLARKARAIARWNATQEEMARFRDERQRKLVEMIRRANERKEELGAQCVLAERAKKIALACRRWESSREEFASLLRERALGTAGEEDSNKENDEGHHSAADGGYEQKSYIVDCMGRLGDTTHRFWDKYNVAKLDVLTLEKKVRRLKRREEALKKKLQAYRDGITVNDNVLTSRGNPLFVINGRINSMPDNAKRQGLGKKKRVARRPTVVDSRFFVAKPLPFPTHPTSIEQIVVSSTR